MPSINENRIWNDNNSWQDGGNEWSRLWGGTDNLWNFVIYPKIKKYLPAENILEIAPGRGRMTNFLRKCCQKLFIVDLNENCINYCKKIFLFDRKIKYFVNDGLHLNDIKDTTINFVFSWDSFVHMEKDVVESYLQEISRVLKENGVGFIHHSNLAQYPNAEIKNWRANSVDYIIFKQLAEKYGLKIISQELVNWNTNIDLIDCISIFMKTETETSYNLSKNNNFLTEAEKIKKEKHIYSQRYNLIELLINKYYLYQTERKELLGKIGLSIKKYSPNLYYFLKRFFR